MVVILILPTYTNINLMSTILPPTTYDKQLPTIEIHSYNICAILADWVTPVVWFKETIPWRCTTGCSLSNLFCLFGSLVPHQHQGQPWTKETTSVDHIYGKNDQLPQSGYEAYPLSLTLKPEARWKGICKFVLIFSLYTSLYNITGQPTASLLAIAMSDFIVIVGSV